MTADPSGSAPLSPECLCQLGIPGGNSGIVVHDTIFFGSSMRSLRAVTGLSSRASGSSACSESTFSGFEANDNLWNGGLNDCNAVDTTLGTFLVALSTNGLLVIFGPVLDTALSLQSSIDYWVMPTTNSDAGFVSGGSFGAHDPPVVPGLISSPGLTRVARR